MIRTAVGILAVAFLVSGQVVQAQPATTPSAAPSVAAAAAATSWPWPWPPAKWCPPFMPRQFCPK